MQTVNCVFIYILNKYFHDKYTHFLSSVDVYLFYTLLLLLLFCTFYSIAHFTLISPFLPYICSCVVLLYIIFIFILLHCPPDLIYISLLIIPCIIYHVTNKETLNLIIISINSSVFQLSLYSHRILLLSSVLHY